MNILVFLCVSFIIVGCGIYCMKYKHENFFPLNNPINRPQHELLYKTEANIDINCYFFRTYFKTIDVLFYEKEIYVYYTVCKRYVKIEFDKINLSNKFGAFNIEFNKHGNSYKLIISKEDYEYTKTWLDKCNQKSIVTE